MKRDHAFGVGLAGGDAQARVPVWISVQAVETESGDLAAASATPAQKQQRRSLIGIVQSLNGHDQADQISAWYEPRQGQRQLQPLATAAEWPARHSVPGPRAG